MQILLALLWSDVLALSGCLLKMARSSRVVIYNIRAHHQCIEKTVCCLWPTEEREIVHFIVARPHTLANSFFVVGVRQGLSIQRKTYSNE